MQIFLWLGLVPVALWPSSGAGVLTQERLLLPPRSIQDSTYETTLGCLDSTDCMIPSSWKARLALPIRHFVYIKRGRGILAEAIP